MGIKGSKNTGESVLMADLIVEKLSTIIGISSKKMFGGNGVFCEGQMFCIVDSAGKAFLKADDSNRADFEAAGAEQHTRMPYFSIPEAVFNDPEQLVRWAKKSIAIKK